MLDTERLNQLFRDYTQDTDETRRVYAADTLLASLWVETGAARERIAAALCCVSPAETENGAPLSAVRLCKRFALSDTDIPKPPPAPAERRKWIGENGSAVALETLTTLMAHTQTEEDAESERARTEAQCVFDLFRLMERLRLSEMFLIPVKFSTLDSGQIASWYRSLQNANSRAMASLPLVALKEYCAFLQSDRVRAEAFLPFLDELHSTEIIPKLLDLVKFYCGDSVYRTLSPRDPAFRERILWAILRALERIGDRRAVSILRKQLRTIDDPNRSFRGSHPLGLGTLRPFVFSELHSLGFSHGEKPLSLSPELIAEIKRVIVAIEAGGSRDKLTLLRPASAAPSDLLRPSISQADNDAKRNSDELLRPN